MASIKKLIHESGKEFFINLVEKLSLSGVDVQTCREMQQFSKNLDASVIDAQINEKEEALDS